MFGKRKLPSDNEYAAGRTMKSSGGTVNNEVHELEHWSMDSEYGNSLLTSSPFDPLISMTQEESADNVMWVESADGEQQCSGSGCDWEHNHNTSSLEGSRKKPSTFSLGSLHPPPRAVHRGNAPVRSKISKARNSSRKPLRSTSLNELIGILNVGDQKSAFASNDKENLHTIGSRPPKRPPVPAFHDDSSSLRNQVVSSTHNPSSSSSSGSNSNSNSSSSNSSSGSICDGISLDCIGSEVVGADPIPGIAMIGRNVASPSASSSLSNYSHAQLTKVAASSSSSIVPSSSFSQIEHAVYPSSAAPASASETAASGTTADAMACMELTEDDLRAIDMAISGELSQQHQQQQHPNSQPERHIDEAHEKLSRRSLTAPSVLSSPPGKQAHAHPASAAANTHAHTHNHIHSHNYTHNMSYRAATSASEPVAEVQTSAEQRNTQASQPHSTFDLDIDLEISDDLLATIENIEKSADAVTGAGSERADAALTHDVAAAALQIKVQPVHPHPDLIICVQFVAVEVEEDVRLQTKTVRAKQKRILTAEDHHAPSQWGLCIVEIRDDWFFTQISAGDEFNVVDMALDVRYHQRKPSTSSFDLDSSGLFHQLLTATSYTDEAPARIVVDGNRGLLVVHPHVFVTPTKVAESCACVRRGVITDRLRSFGDINAAAVMGNLKHSFMEILTEQLLNILQGMQLQSSNDLQLVRKKLSGTTMRTIVNRCRAQHLLELYIVGYEDADIEKELIALVEPTIRWVWICYTQSVRGLIAANLRDQNKQNQPPHGAAVHNHNKSTQMRDASFDYASLDGVDYQIKKLAGVEETIWSSMLGMRGQIDLVSQSKMRILPPAGSAAVQAPDLVEQILLPIEFKTGKWRPSTVVAHRAQIMLYVLMLLMRERAGTRLLAYSHQQAMHDRKLPPQPIHGMILYMNEQEMKVDIVKPNWIEVKALIISRNNLALSMKHAADFTVADGTEITSALPPMIKSQFDCKYCYQAAECMVHHLAHESGTSHSSGVDEVFNFVVRGLNPKDVEYLKHWEHLINLEAIATQQRAQQRTSDSYDSEYSKKQLRGLTFVNCVKIAEPVHSENFLLTLSLRGGTLVSDEAVDSNQDYQLGDRLQVSVDINSAVADRIFFNGSSAGGNSAVPAAADHRHPTAATATSAAGTATATSTAVGDIEDLGSVTTARYPVIAASSQRAMTTEMNICMGKLHTKEVLDGDQSSLIQLELEGKPYTLFQLMQCFPDACAMNQFLTFRIAKDDLSVNITTMRSNLMQLFTRPFNPKKFNELAGASAPTGRANAGENSGQQEHFDQSSQLAATWRELIVGLRAPRCSLSGERLDSQQGASYRGTAVVEGADLIMLMRPKSIDESAFRKALQALHTFLNVNPNIPTVRRGQHGEFVVMDNTLVVYPGCNPLLLAKEFVALNAGQQQAVVRIMHAEDYSLMLGLPGTGKTTVLALVVRMLIARGDRVILASFTHSAVDHLLAKLCGAGMTAIHLTRIGASQHVDMKLRSLILDPVQLKTIEQLRIVCKSRSRLFACTALTASRNALLRSLQFDVCVMDEAGQIAQPVALGAVVRARRAVLVGDTFQLPPLVVSKDAQRLGMGESLLKRLCDAHPQAVCALTSQYRMNKDILAVSNALIYENKMTCGSASVANAQLRLPNMQHLSSMSRPSHDWIRRSLQPDISVVLVNTDRIYSERGLLSAVDGVAASRANEVEAKLAASIVDALWRCGFDLSEVGILTPFRDQLHCIKQFVFTESKEASTTASVRSGSITSGATSGSTSSKTTCSLADSDISTVDRFQGRDKDVIILSLVRRPPPQRAAVPSTGGEDPAHGAELLHDWRRLNVAITRAKLKLIIIGSITFMQSVPPLRSLMVHISRSSNREGIIDATLS